MGAGSQLRLEILSQQPECECHKPAPSGAGFFVLWETACGPLQKNPASGGLAGSEGGAVLSGLFFEQKRVNAALFAVLQQFIAGGSAKGLEIGH